MFGFSKKKSGDAAAQGATGANGKPSQLIKVEDDMASFEIPDFSDDDLNFDLGIGEFMPKDGAIPQQIPPEPKGLEIPPMSDVPSMEEAGNAEEIPPIPPQQVQSSQESQVPEFQPLKMPEFKSNKEEQEKQDKKTALKEMQTTSESDIQETPAETQETQELFNEESEELPKFSINSPAYEEQAEQIKPAIAIAENEGKKKKSKESLKTEKAENKTTSKVHLESFEPKKKEEPKHYAQASADGFFVPKEVYRKIVVLTDDVLRKSEHGEDVKKHYSSLSKMKKEAFSAADKDSKTIRDLMMSADSKLFDGR